MLLNEGAECGPSGSGNDPRTHSIVAFWPADATALRHHAILDWQVLGFGRRGRDGRSVRTSVDQMRELRAMRHPNEPIRLVVAQRGERVTIRLNIKVGPRLAIVATGFCLLALARLLVGS